MSLGSIPSVTSLTGVGAIGTLRPTDPTQSLAGASAGKDTRETEGIGFGEFLKNAIGEANALQQTSDGLTDDFIAGRTDSIHEVMIAAEKASVSLQLILEIRNKVLEAYQEINRMQI